MTYNFVADRIHAKKLCSRLSSSEVEFFHGRIFENFLANAADKVLVHVLNVCQYVLHCL